MTASSHSSSDSAKQSTAKKNDTQNSPASPDDLPPLSYQSRQPTLASTDHEEASSPVSHGSASRSPASARPAQLYGIPLEGEGADEEQHTILMAVPPPAQENKGSEK